MASRFSFGIMGQTTGELLSGLTITIKDDAGNVKADSTPSAGELQVIDNSDGTYYVDSLATGTYTVYTNNVVQDELKNISHIDDTGVTKINTALTTSDLKTTANSGADVVWAGSLLTTQLAGKEDADVNIIKTGELSDNTGSDSITTAANSKAVKDAKDLCVLKANVVDNLTSSDTDKPLSAKQGKHLEDNKLETSSVVNDVTTGGTTVPLSAAQGVALKADITAINEMATVNSGIPTTLNTDDFVLNGAELKVRQSNITSQNYVSPNNSLFQNMSILDQRLGFLTTNDSGEGTWVVLWANDSAQARANATGLLGAETTLVENFLIDEGNGHSVQTYYPIFRMSLYKIPSVRELAFYYKGKVDAGSEGKVKLTCSTLSVEGANIVTTSYTTLKGLYLDIRALANYEVYDIKVEMKINDADAGNQTFEIKDTMLVGKYQVSGNIDEQENPSA